MMRCFVFLFLIFNSFYIYAQDTHALDFKPKEVWLEGQISYNGFESRLPDFNQIPDLINTNARGHEGNFLLQANYFFAQNFSVGLGGGFGMEYFKYPNEDYKYNGYSFIARGSLKYYFLNFAERFHLYGEIASEYRGTNYNIEYLDVETTEDLQNLLTGVNIGITYFVNYNVTVSAVIMNNFTHNYNFENGEGDFNFNPNIFKNFIEMPTFSVMLRL